MRNILEDRNNVIDQRVYFFMVDSHSLDRLPFLYFIAQLCIAVDRHH